MTARKQKSQEPARRVTAAPARARNGTILALILASAAAVLVYANAFKGDFVYDDTKQIVGNSLIQESGRFTQAMTSDVWAFKGEKGSNWSNYWRPVFILWLMANYRAFGLGSTVGWHVTNALLHALVVVLAFELLRRLRVDVPIAFAIVLIFAVHPAHVESVAWISGSGDLVLAAALIGSLSCLIAYRERPGPPALLIASYVLYAIALLSKEIGILFPLIVLAAVYSAREGERGAAGARKARIAEAVRTVVPYAVLTGVYIVVHLLMLGQAQIKTPWQVGPVEQILTIPSLLFFYFRQCLFPLWMGPSYPLRVVTPASLGLLNFWGPLLFVAAASILLVRLSRRDPVRRIGLALFFVPLIPPMNVNAFIPEQIVHDRYLYLPLLGLLMVVVPAFAETVQRRLAPSTAGPRAESAAAAGAPPVVSPAAAGSRLAARVREGGRPDPSSRTGDSLLGASRAQKATVYAAVLCCVPLSLKTLSYNRAWTSEMNLWSAAISSDPTSATNYAEYGRVLLTAGRTAEAKAALDRAVSIFPVTTAYLQRADLAVTERRFADAESDLKLVLASYPDNNAAYERLAIVYQQQGRLPEAEALLRTAREKIPHRRCSFTDSLAVVLYLEGRKSDALQELESVRADAPRELGSSAQSVLFHLGSLYSELGRAADARSALEEYLRLSAGLTDKQSIEYRNQARTNLSRLPG